MEYFNFGEDFLTVGKALAISNGAIKGQLSDLTKKKVEKSALRVAEIVDKGMPVYGINTGFGPLCTTSISKEKTKILQSNILQSHSVGVGKPITNQLAKLMLILKVHALAKGFSGIQLQTLERIIWHIEKDITPVVPSQGSVGASGDLAPLSHLFLPLLGLGKVAYRGKIYATQKLFKELNVYPLELGAKEGLALINGTQFILAHAALVVKKLQSVLQQADIIGAMMLEGLQGSSSPFDERLHNLRPFKGNQHVAGRIRTLLNGSEILEDHFNCDRVQDPYSLRCMPQVHGASRNTWLHLKELVEIELNSVTDNPVIVDDNESISGGNFHGQPLAMALDYATLATSELGNISDRRIYLALEGGHGVPQLLMKDTGINSGYMILQYTSAALASENKSLCFPSSADSIPTSMGQEDHVSMGSISGRKALQVIQNVEKILAIELLTAAQAFEFRKPLKSGVILNEVHRFVRTKVAFAEKDRVFADDINIAIDMISDESLIDLINEVMAKENISWLSQYTKTFETL
ncbi:histidine ammonia-lyase [Croceivirga lutea]|uniref:histidine ammonia-lyase n=1 Tax=Croceivirga lutea TaxID=1775167 RepID=UPI001639CF50|nr:histidine ammonia-lyase [Croceivirga lutea]GGG41860.1 histidine ammonia-lyase [Croceivirga lutea]